jgi:Fe-S-cluster-containing dehydrogenase component
MPKYGMLLDPNKCTGCNACRIACQMQWSLPPHLHYNRLEEHLKGSYPDLRRVIVPLQCQHCEDPPCQEVCPTQATYKREDGIVMVDAEKCIGCKYCLTACPYEARVIDEQGIARKCSFCAKYVAQGALPACVATCMCEVRIFGDLSDPKSEISRQIAKPNVRRIEGTSMYYVVPEKADAAVLPQALISPLHVGIYKKVAQPAGKAVMGLAAAAVLGAVVVNTVKGGKNNE